MKNMQADQKFVQLSIILLTMFIFIFFTRSYYEDLIWNLDVNEEKNKIYQEKLDEANYLSIKQKKLEKATEWGKQTKEYKEIKKYLEPVSEDKLIEEIYWAISNRINGKVEVVSLSMWEWVKNELGFLEAKLTISLIAEDKETIKDLFDYLNNDSKYKIFVNSFNMPKRVGVSGYKIQIPATIFYVKSNKKENNEKWKK